MRAAIWILLFALLGCAPSAAQQKQQIEDRIALQQDAIKAIEADAIRRRAENAASQHELSNHPDILLITAETTKQAESAHTEFDDALIADHRSAIDRLRRELADLEHP